MDRRKMLAGLAGLSASGAALPAMAAMAPVAASAVALQPPHSDRDLSALLDRFDAARTSWDATEAPFDDALARARAAYPLRPEPLQWRRTDFPRTSYGRAASDAVGDTGDREYGPRGVAWLRRLRTTVQWDEAAEARRQEIVEAHDRWMAARKAVEDATGYTAIADAYAVAAEAFNAAEDAVKLCQPLTLAGLARKAAWVAGRLSDADPDSADDDLGEVFARQVASFGGAAS